MLFEIKRGEGARTEEGSYDESVFAYEDDSSLEICDIEFVR